jgi:hypothetical protein
VVTWSELRTAETGTAPNFVQRSLVISHQMVGSVQPISLLCPPLMWLDWILTHLNKNCPVSLKMNSWVRSLSEAWTMVRTIAPRLSVKFKIMMWTVTRILSFWLNLVMVNMMKSSHTISYVTPLKPKKIKKFILKNLDGHSHLLKVIKVQ